ncbi:histidinol-phosphate transaminase [Embleya hyalina]|uniref:Histidinol-phosphate aminotransferase n=1 Tax=Embleya hyalina TaxID=516124 RepID=A0A401Z1S7_9ACTN|nr:histidinol-phosphate transaminase [Embleya hyalina]GCE00794.1 putative phenylalanine aminotransferase [Embleya hyalina]
MSTENTRESGPRLRAVLDAPALFEPSVAPRAAGPARLLGSNESPHDPLPEIVAAMADAALYVNRYPDYGGRDLTATLSRVHGVPEDRIVPGAGSIALLQMLFQAVGEPGAEVVYAWRSFELYPVLADLAGVRSVRVPLSDGGHDLGAMAERIGDRTRMVVVCNPNNPTGTVVGHEEFAEFMLRVPSDVLVVLDEAYFEYVRDPGVVSGLVLHRRWPNLVVLRTFSKAYGLAGLRVGYLVGDPAITTRVRRAYLAYSLNTPAQAAAVRALELRERLLDRVEEAVGERTRLRDALRAAGMSVSDSQANFLWLPLGGDSAAFARRCAEDGIAVRVFPDEGVRVSIGARGDNEAFATTCERWMQHPSSDT